MTRTATRRPRYRDMTPQECVEYAARKSDGLPEPLRLQVYWGTIMALAINPPRLLNASPRARRKQT